MPHCVSRFNWLVVRVSVAGLMFGMSVQAFAASCCGGGSASTLVLPKFSDQMVDLSVDWEAYDGYWDKDGNWKPDPSGSDLNQYRVNFGYAHRLGDRWQGSISVPYIFNDNRYSGLTSHTDGLGDSAISLWYEAFDGVMCVTAVNSPKDLLPATYLGATLTIPTGISPYDDVSNNFDITGRGFYRLDANLSVEKSIGPWNTALKLSYGKHRERDVNREYGKYVEPYTRLLGDRSLASFSLGYSAMLPSMDSLTTTVVYAYLQEEAGTIAGQPDPSTGFEKQSVSISLAYATLSRRWVYRLSWNHALDGDGYGENFPTTEVLTLGVSHVY